MLTRAIIMGSLLAVFTGGVVYLGLEQAVGENSASLDAETDIAAAQPAAQAVEKFNAAEEAEISQTITAELDDMIAAKIAPNTGLELSAPKANETDTQALETFDADEEAEISETIMAELDGMIDAKIISQSEAGLPDLASAAPINAAPSAQETVKAMMKPEATGTFRVKGDVSSGASENLASETLVKEAPAKVMSAQETAKSRAALKDNLKSARMITNKTTRDKIYFEVFENAIEDGHIDMARNISAKLSTPELRGLAREAIGNAQSAVQ